MGRPVFERSPASTAASLTRTSTIGISTMGLLARRLAGLWPRRSHRGDLETDHLRPGRLFEMMLLRAVTESTGDAIFILDSNGRITDINAEAERLFGWSRHQLAGQTLLAVTHNPLVAQAADAADNTLGRTVVAAHASARQEAAFFRRDGTTVMVECYYAPIPLDGKATGVVLTVRDLTPRRRAEAAARESEARLAGLLSTLGLAKILVRDPDDTIRFWSQGCESLYGWSVAEAVGQRSSVLLGTVPSVPADKIEAALLRDGEWAGDLTQTCRDGRSIVVAVRKVLQRDADGMPSAIMESIVDVTVPRRAQAGLHQLNRDLEERVSLEVASREAAQARAAHAERMQALGQLAGGIAHDFNNILQVVSGSAALIERRQGDPAAINRYVRRIIDSSNRGATITRRMLVFARRSTLEAEPGEPVVVLEGVREICACTLPAGIEIRLKCAPDLPRLLADKGQLETALVNLATNARDAMVDGGILTLSATAEMVMPGDNHAAALEPGRYIRLDVADTGGGMDSTVLARVTEPFFTTKGIGEGTGLGLSMVKGFAEQSGGGFAVISKPGIGTVASMWLPQAEDAEAAGRREAGGEVRPPGAGCTVLLVDDDHLVRETLAAQLEAEGHFVLSASGGEDALALLDTPTPIDILVTDLAMPRMNGLSLIQAAQRQRSRLPTILLTGYAEDAAALAAGSVVEEAYVVIHKPVSGAQLANLIAAMLRPAAERSEPPPTARLSMTQGA